MFRFVTGDHFGQAEPGGDGEQAEVVLFAAGLRGDEVSQGVVGPARLSLHLLAQEVEGADLSTAQIEENIVTCPLRRVESDGGAALLAIARR